MIGVNASGAARTDCGPAASTVPKRRLGGTLSAAWVAYRRRLDAELAAAGFDDHAFPDGRVLKICGRRGEATISDIGRELRITRQGAGKIVASLADRGYVTVTPSATNGREKAVRLTPRATAYLTAHRRAVRRIESELEKKIGTGAIQNLQLVIQVLGDDDQPRMIDYIRHKARTLAGAFYLDE
jgi:DNA-binding MarR family transcriptional regulator